MSTESQVNPTKKSQQSLDDAHRAKLQAAAADREAAELRAATETRTDAEAKAAARTIARSPAQLAQDAESARRELARTLDEIEARLNPVTQAKRLVHDGQRRLKILRRRHPEYLIAGAAGVAALGAGLVWLGVRTFRR